MINASGGELQIRRLEHHAHRSLGIEGFLGLCRSLGAVILTPALARPTHLRDSVKTTQVGDDWPDYPIVGFVAPNGPAKMAWRRCCQRCSRVHCSAVAVTCASCPTCLGADLGHADAPAQRSPRSVVPGIRGSISSAAACACCCVWLLSASRASATSVGAMRGAGAGAGVLRAESPGDVAVVRGPPVHPVSNTPTTTIRTNGFAMRADLVVSVFRSMGQDWATVQSQAREI